LAAFYTVPRFARRDRVGLRSPVRPVIHFFSSKSSVCWINPDPSVHRVREPPHRPGIASACVWQPATARCPLQWCFPGLSPARIMHSRKAVSGQENTQPPCPELERDRVKHSDVFPPKRQLEPVLNWEYVIGWKKFHRGMDGVGWELFPPISLSVVSRVCSPRSSEA